MAKLLRLSLYGVILMAMATVSVQADDGCNNDIANLVNECKQFVLFPANPKIPPSDACCGVVQKVNIPCLCNKVDGKIEQMVCMEKVVYVAGYCKRPLAPGSKCGSYTVPPGGSGL